MEASKDIVYDFYQSDALINKEKMQAYLHPEVTLEWDSSKGFHEFDHHGLLKLADELERSYNTSRVEISHLLQEDNLVTLRYRQYVTLFENPTEEIALAKFIVIWELKEQKLFKGYQMSQLS
ncbi:nuclear transport factor 2 family protein [Flavobacterium sp. '19STA2R22 D10 B1']|uniref:nuclear transport factor 2 family protein n=1 Tax=Flavobacterium aerium TaxID=3037261 RepID=UPI00278C7430|nr:nuclear transport factor 2 family protein [Flavobacterium sp. '19STA2R22 D10 B1']